MQKTSQSTTPAARAGGVPGTGSNAPAAAVPAAKAEATKADAAKPDAAVPPLMQTATAALPVYPQAGAGAAQVSTEESGTYGVTKHLVHEERGPGRVRRVTAAIVVNDRMASEGAGKLEHTVWKPRSTEEMTRLEQLAKAAVGFEVARGDEVVVENVGFSSNVPEVVPTGTSKLMDEASEALHGQPGFSKSVGVIALILLLVMVVVRPLTRQMVTAMSVSSGPMLLASSIGPNVERAASLGGGQGQPVQVGAGAPSVNIFQHVSQQIRQEPAQSTRLLETWIGETVEERKD
jgi:flagellar M-ring protein FliF